MNLTPSEQLAHSTVRVVCELADGQTSTGTGFFYNFAKVGDKVITAIVTNKHVVKGAVRGLFHLTMANSTGSASIGEHFSVELDQFEGRWIPHPSPDVDLCVMPVAPIVEHARQRGTPAFHVTLDERSLPSPDDLNDLGAFEDVLMIGYPNGIWDAVNNMPILRRGVTATHPNIGYEGRQEFMIDAACFPGSSGSPVFLYNPNGWMSRNGTFAMGAARIKLLGILYGGPQHMATGEVRVVTIPTQQRVVATSPIPNNLGLVIKSARLRELDLLLRDMFKHELAGAVAAAAKSSARGPE